MTYRTRRMIGVALIAAGMATAVYQYYHAAPTVPSEPQVTVNTPVVATDASRAAEVLASLAVKGRAPKTNYSRVQFGDGWLLIGNCDTRNVILNRDLINTVVDDRCKVLSGKLADPYTGVEVAFTRGETTSDIVQIDHVVALSNAWQTGAQGLALEERIAFANDPLELLAVDGSANQAKADGDAATWLPANKAFRCQYVARQIAVKVKYRLWVTEAEKSAMLRVLETCPDQMVPTVK